MRQLRRPVPGETGDYESQPCTYSVYHADGTLVSASQPAKGGEVVVAYAFGLGAPDVRMQSGAAALPVCRRARRRALTT